MEYFSCIFGKPKKWGEVRRYNKVRIFAKTCSKKDVEGEEARKPLSCCKNKDCYLDCWAVVFRTALHQCIMQGAESEQDTRKLVEAN